LEGTQDIEITQTDDGLLIAGKPSQKHEVVAIDVSNYSIRSIENVLYQAYRKGYNKIVLKNIGKNESKIARIAKEALFGFDITATGGKTITLENITEPSPQKFEIIFRKVFQLIKTESLEIFKELTEGKYIVESRFEARRTTDNYTNFCRRIILNDRIGGIKDSYLLYTFVSNLSLIAHSYYYLHNAASSHRITAGKKTIRLVNEINGLFMMLYDAFYKKDPAICDKIEQEYEMLIVRCDDIISSTPKDSLLSSKCAELVRLIHINNTIVFGLTNVSNSSV